MLTQYRLRTILIFLIVFISAINAQWHWQNPTPIGIRISDIKFTDELTGYVCGAGGLFLKTTDGGNKWAELKTPSDGLILEIFFLNNETGWYLTYGDYSLYKTTDGGINWTFVSNFSPRYATTIWFLDELNGFAGGYNNLLKTSDGGLTWSEVNNTFSAYSIFFLTKDIGLISVPNGIKKTTNGGVDWQPIGMSVYNFTPSKIFALDTNNIYVVGSGDDFYGNILYYAFYQTSNGGINWTGKTFTSQITDVFFESPAKGWLCAGKILRTINGGISWDTTNGAGLRFDFEGSHSWSAGDNTISYSDDGWQTATPQISSIFSGFLWDGYAKDKNNVYACGSNETILGTKDGGINWQKYYSSPENIHLNAITAFNNEIWSVGEQGKVVYSTDNGNNWVEKTIAGKWLSDIIFLSDGTGYIAGSADSTGAIFSSTDGGETWNLKKSFTNLWSVDKIKFSSDNLGWAVGSPQSIMRSTDKGLTWETVVDSIFAVSNIAISGDTAWFTYYNKVLRTIDAGKTWESFKVFDYNNVIFSGCDIDFVNSIVGYVSAYDSRIFKSTDGGISWNKEDIPNGLNNFAIDFIDENIGWAFGYPGTILKRDPNYTSVNNHKEFLPSDFYLNQNYPNPFNPTTIINYSIPKASFVTIKVYDILGREITTLVNEQKSPGNYNVQFNASRFSSGVYFYRMQAGDFVQTKKLVLLK
jgi:photosystem II stability/assembly factor-like uncharacterized protein